MDLGTMLKHKNKRIDELKNVHTEMNNTLFHHCIIPFCNKFHLDFVSGMGTFFFKNKKGTHIVTRDNYTKFTTDFWKAYLFVEEFIWDINDSTKFLGGGYNYKA